MCAPRWVLMGALAAAGACRDSSGDAAAPPRDAAREPTHHTANGALGPRADVVVDAITAGDDDFLAQRPALAASKYALMATNAFAFFRGALALYLHDWLDPASGLATTVFDAAGVRPVGLGDAHPENFGVLRSAGGVFRVEPNDFDTADRLPYLWDVRRFAIAMCVAAREANAGDPAARAASAAADRAVAHASIASYADTMQALAAGGARPAIEDGGGNEVLDDVFARARTDWERREELERLTVSSDGVRRLVRGTPDPLQPAETTRDLPSRGRAEIASALASLRATLPNPPPVTELAPLDAVQVFGQGIGSLPRVRALALVRGASTEPRDDVVVELKELPAQGAPPLPQPTAFRDPATRVLAALQAAFTERGADPLWGVGTWLGQPVQLRTEAAGFKTIRVARLEGPRGTPTAIEGLGVALARLLARMHAAPVDGTSAAEAIAGVIRVAPDAFVDEQTAVALRACDQVAADWELFKQALALLGPTLGVAGDPSAAPSPELRVLFDPAADPRSAGVDVATGPFVLNEIAAAESEYVEVANATSTKLAAEGLAVADADVDGGPRFDQAARLSAGATLAGRGRVVFVGGFKHPEEGPRRADCVAGLPTCYHAAWNISGAKGETMFLLSPDDVIIDQVAFPASGLGTGQTWQRRPDLRGSFSAGLASPGRPNP